MDPTLTQAIAGLIAALTVLVGSAGLAVKAHVGSKKLGASIATNHGKRPGEYLEMVADVQVDVQTLAKKVDKVIDMIADHTVQDSQNFAEIRAMFAASDEAAATETADASKGRVAAARRRKPLAA